MTSHAMLSLTSSAPLPIYPGGATYWELLWIQNVLLVFVQFTTGAALFTQDYRYSSYVTAPLEAAGWTGRHSLVLVHVAGGVLLVGVNIVFAGSWLSTSWFAAQPVMTATTLVLSSALAGMALFGASLYANLRPDTRLPLWSFDYAFSRKLHRLLFVVVVATLGYHLFLTPRVYVVWERWLQEFDLFGVLALMSLLVWGVLVGQSAVMVGEWATGRVFSRWRTRLGVVSLIGGSAAVFLTVGSVFEMPATYALVVAVVLAGALLVRRLGVWRPGGTR